jgi:hypothetical protein
MSDTTFIYALVDPRTSSVRYVGKSNYPFHRLRAHQTRKGVNRDKDAWVAELEAGGMEPTVKVLAEVDASEWREQEEHWIQEMLKAGPLFNKVRKSKHKKVNGVQLIMTREEKQMLKALAEANTGGNISMMARRLVKIASTMPEIVFA